MSAKVPLVKRSQGGDVGWPLRHAAALHAGADAVVDADRAVTYAQLERRVGALGAALDELGIEPGARIGYLGVNSPAHVECAIGVPAFGRVLVDLNFRLAQAELAFMVDDCRLEALVVDPAQLEVGRALLSACASLRLLVVDGAADDAIAYEALLDREPIEPPGVDEHALATISYTGGTTGAPKGVMLSHANLLANARHNLIATGHSSADRWLHVCPMFHVAGTSNLYAATWVGAKQIVLPRFAAGHVIDTIARERVTHTSLVPTMIAMLLEELDRRPAERLESLRHLQYAASPITPDVQRRLLERLDCDVVQFYGMTEAAPTVTQLSAEDHRHGRRLRSIGRPVVGVRAEIRNLEGARVAPGEVGELCVRGPNVMLGYWNRPEATEAALADGWYRTGDAGRADEDGYLHLVDRLKDMIVTGAENVYSIEVEAALAEHESVEEAAVFGVPDARWGEAVHAVVSVAPGATVTAEELVAHCRRLIAGYKIPRSIDVRTEPLPRSAPGKLLKNQLRDPFWAGHDRRVN